MLIKAALSNHPVHNLFQILKKSLQKYKERKFLWEARETFKPHLVMENIFSINISIDRISLIV